MYDTTMRNMQRNLNKLNDLDEKKASGRMINRPSDNPVGFTNAMNYRNILNSLTQNRTNMDDGEIYMDVLETSHKTINNVFERVQELAVQGSNDPQTHEQRTFINLEVRQQLEQLVSLAQSKHKDNYIFSGKWVNQPPYEIKIGAAKYDTDNMAQTLATNPAHIPGDPTSPDLFEGTGPVTIQLYDANYHDPNLPPPDNNPLAQRIIPSSLQLNGDLKEKPNKNEDLNPPSPDYEIDYVNGTITLLSSKAKEAFYDIDGNLNAEDNMPEMSFDYIYRNSIDMSGEIYREVESGVTMKINTNPDDIFGKAGPNETDSFKEIIALMQGLWTNEQSEIAQGIDKVDAARERNIAQQAVEGARLNRVGITYERNLDLAIANTKAQSKIEDVDLANIMSEWSMADAVYNSSLQTAATLMNRSLMDYL